MAESQTNPPFQRAKSGQFREVLDRLHLSYRVRIGGEWEDVDETVRIVRTPCRFGGTRPYFICPGVVNGIACGRRMAKLYGPGRHFLCRHCYCLAHACESEDAQRRSMRRVSKIMQRLGGNAGTASPFPPKPKGMWRRTYERLRERWTPRSAPTRRSCLTSYGYLRGPRTTRRKELLEMNEIKSTLPAKIGGTEVTRFNAVRHGVLSRYTVLPWEDAAEYDDLLRRSSVSTPRMDPPRSIWSRSSPASFGASVA
jgi:hypothetical protein